MVFLVKFQSQRLYTRAVVGPMNKPAWASGHPSKMYHASWCGGYIYHVLEQGSILYAHQVYLQLWVSLVWINKSCALLYFRRHSLTSLPLPSRVTTRYINTTYLAMYSLREISQIICSLVDILRLFSANHRGLSCKLLVARCFIVKLILSIN